MKNNLIHIENKFALEARYKMNLIEQKVFYALVAKLNPHEENEFGEISFTVMELKRILASEGKVYNSLYSRLQGLKKSMLAKVFEFPTPVEIEGKVFMGGITFFQSIVPRYNRQDEAAIYFRFNDLLKPFLLQLNEYVKFNQLYIAKLKSTYSIRLYTTLKAIRSKRQKYEQLSIQTWEVEGFKGLIGAEGQYPRFCDFKRRTIKVAFKEINEKTDIKIIKIDYIKHRRVVTNIVFTFTDQAKEKALSQPLKASKPQTPKKKKTQKNTNKKYVAQIQNLTLAQHKAFKFLSHETRGINTKIILEEILPSIAKMGEVPRGFEDIYVQKVWEYVQRKSKEKNPESWAAIFVSWWRNTDSLNHDKNKAIFFDALHEFKRSIKGSPTEKNRRIAQGLPFIEAMKVLGMIKEEPAQNPPVPPKEELSKRNEEVVGLGGVMSDIFRSQDRPK